MITTLKISTYLLLFALTLGLITNSQAQEAPAAKEATATTDPKVEKAQRSYAYGAIMAKNLARTPLTAEEKNIDQFIKGLKKGLEGDAKALETAQANLQKRFGGGGTASVGTDVMYDLGVSALGAIAVEIDIPKDVFDYDEIKKGYEDASAGKESKMTDKEMEAMLNNFFKPYSEAYQKKMEEKELAAAQKAISEGKAFLEKNGKRDGVITLPSGLQYEVIVEGKGAQPTAADKVQTHYHGTLIDGTVFDSSVERGEPATFGVNQVIKGWQEGIPLMRVGSKYKFYIPQELAYGLKAPSPKIPGGSTLVFEVELLDINPGEKDLMRTIQAGQDFLTENAKKPGVVILPSGLQYVKIVEGEGANPTPADRVKVHYHGTLIDGTVFDSSVDRGQPATFGVMQVIQGWQEGIPLMKVGSKYRFFIPYELAYGKRAMGAKIPAGSALIFDVELFEINPK
ncbi:MAG: FKBP-type peptidyl-prolyl cis-trans isomerase [Aureispira sp.]